MKNALSLFALALLVSGCMGTYFNNARVRQLQVGMSQQQVREIMGKPYSTIASADGTTKWVWAYGTAVGYGRGASVIFREGVAVSVPPVPAE